MRRLDHARILACEMRQYVPLVGMVKGRTAGLFSTDTGALAYSTLYHAIDYTGKSFYNYCKITSIIGPTGNSRDVTVYIVLNLLVISYCNTYRRD